MNAIDLVLLLPLGLAFIRGYRKGLIVGIFSIIGLIIAVIACMKFTSVVMGWIQSLVGKENWLPFFAYLFTFIGVFLLVLWFGKLIEKLVESASLGTANKLLGAGLSILQACFIISLFFWLLDKVNVLPEKARDGSFGYRTLDGFAPKVIEKTTSWIPWLQDEVKDIEQNFSDKEDSHSA
jgi:membrane protein required for colicin V production